RPLVFIPELLGRICREFSVTIIVAILASGLVSLTRTPLMCARILGERRAGHKRAWMERHTSNFIQRVIGAYGRLLDRFLDRAWLAVPILVARSEERRVGKEWSARERRDGREKTCV